MKKILSAVILCLCINTLFAQTVYRHQVDGEIYVKFTKAALKDVSNEDPNNIPLSKLASVNKILAKYGVTRAYKPFYQADDDAKLPYILKFEFSQIAKVDAFINEMRNVPGIEYAEKVSLNTVDATPNDPTVGTHLTQINAQNAWNVFNSTANGNSNITVAIVDNAVSWTHTDLVANTFTNTLEIPANLIDDDGNGYVDDVNGWDVADNDNNTVPTNTLMNHGTHCAGIAGARTDNATGVASIGWNIKIIPVKCQTNTGSTSGIANGYGGIIYAAKMKARVISCSWGGVSTASSAEQTVIDYAWNRGCIVFCAAGNDGGTANETVLHYPAAYNNVFCVASVATNNVKSSFSCRGTWVDIAAPGENIFSTVPNATTGTYMNMSGTSMATPLVAGLAGLMLSKCPFMSQTDVLNCLSSTAANIYTIAANSTYLAGNQLGAGRIDAFAAMNCSAAFLTYAPIANFFTLTRNICPNVPVSFIDSSLYAPTNFTWTFQGGTPATSTSSNPSVQWTLPGTYSVSEIAANANGSNLKVKTSYITVSGPIALPLSEGFQATQFLPTNWTPYNVNNDANFWTRQTGLGGFGTSTACAIYDNYNLDAAPDRDEMRTPKYIFSNIASAWLRFDVAYKQYDNGFSDTLEVKLSTNCGASWTSIYSKGGSTLSTSAGTLQANIFSPTAAEWRKDTIDVSALTAGQGNVMFSFINHGHYGQALYLDNINLVFPTPTVNFTPPGTACVGSTINLANTSTGASTYTWTMTGGTPASSTATNPTVSYAAPGIYSITLLGANGSSTAAITQTINIISVPVLTVNSPTICPLGNATLTGSGATSYTWNPGALTGGTVVVTPASTTVYTLTGSNGFCSTNKTATVVVSSSPTITVNTPTVCPGNPSTLTASGATSYTWSTGPTTSTITASPLVTTVYTVTGSNGTCSTAKTATIVVTPNPTVSVNNATICPLGTATITASGATTYSWSTGFTGNPLMVSPASNTVYTVIGTSLGCTNTKTVSVTIGSAISINVTSSPTAICIGSTATLTASGATSYTWSTAANGSSIAVTPTTTSTYTVLGTSGSCSGSNTISVVVNQMPTTALAGANQTVCISNPTTTINGNTPIVGSGTWSVLVGTGVVANPNSPSTSVSALSLGINILQWKISNGACNSSSTMTITVDDLPTIAAAISSQTLCSINTATLTGNTPTTGIGTWSLLSGSGTITSPNSVVTAITGIGNGSNVFQWSISNGVCAPSAATVAIVNNSTLTVSAVSASSMICAGSPVNLTASGASTYSWSTGSTNPVISVSPSVTTSYTVTGNNGPCSSSVVITQSVSTCTGIHQLVANVNSLLVYPNPAQNNVTIEYQGVSFNYALYNNLGQVISANKNNQNTAVINLTEFAKGIYLVEVEIGKDKIRKKLIVE